MKVAIIGGGVSGLSLAYFLKNKNIDFVLFEKESNLGGNVHTRKIIHNNKEKHVDMAVNDFNPKTYKVLTNLLEETNSSTGNVKVDTTFFSAGNFLFKESEITDNELVDNITRFKKEAVEVLFNAAYEDYTVEKYFEEKGYSAMFLKKYLYPRIQGLFFFPPDGLNSLPVYFVMNFYALQSGFQLNGLPLSVRNNFTNGAGNWIENFSKLIPEEQIVKSEIPKIVKTRKGFKISYSTGEVVVDKLAFACHADDLCNSYSNILSKKQSEILSKVNYAKMISIVHCDKNYLPLKGDSFSAYNCLVEDFDVENKDYTITYNCNEHQNLSNGGNNLGDSNDFFFVTVNPTRKIEDEYILKDTDGVPLVKEFSRNVCDFEMLKAQRQLKFHQGEEGIYFVGGYTNGIGLHENCLNQSQEIAEAIHKIV